LTLAQMSCSTS